jgi:hypothetical protein
MVGFRILSGQASKLGIADAKFYVSPACEHLRLEETNQTRRNPKRRG